MINGRVITPSVIDNLRRNDTCGKIQKTEKRREYTYNSNSMFMRYNRTAITLGNFDGMHLGHMRLIEILTRRASELGAPALVYTFDEHPRNVISGAGSVKLLTGGSKKRELLSETAIDYFYTERFDMKLASLTPEAFVGDVLVKKFGVRLVVVGSDFRFGRGGCGDIGILKKLGAIYGFSVEEVRPVVSRIAKINEYGIISSSSIRALIATGQMEQAGAMLGRLFSLKCWISAYYKMTDFRYKTTAVHMYPDMRMAVPPPGVYITGACIEGVLCKGFAEVCAGIGSMKSVTAVINYFLDFDGDLHETEIEIFFYRKLSGDAGVDAGEKNSNRLERYAADTGRYFVS